MSYYEKWLGAGIGWVLTGNPIGGVLGFIAGTMMGKDKNHPEVGKTKGITEFEANLIVLASHLIKVDSKVSLTEISFVNDFLNKHFDEKYSNERSQVLNHCLNKEYDLNTACDQIRMYTDHGTHVQVVHFLFDLALCDGDLSERENYFIFRISGFLNVHDVDFRKMKTVHTEREFSDFEILGVKREDSIIVIRNSYRKLILKYHPDRNQDIDAIAKKKLEQKIQRIHDAYNRIKAARKVS
ncbi:MAG: TerB family tellurite resistance protein [Bacteroidetes bacterium]|nr:TerB family tellurite resistance protein [Bacteroidota bacterium]